MSATIAQDDLTARTLQLPDDFYHHMIHTLRPTLPSPLTNSPEDHRRRDSATVARIAALVPANAAEADIAGLYVAASEQWKECLRLAQLPETPLQQAIKHRALANAMMRQAQGALRLLLRMQTIRGKREATNQSCDRAAFTEQCAIDLMLDALGSASGTAEPRPTPLATTGQDATRSPLTPPVPKAEAEPIHSSPPAPPSAPQPGDGCDTHDHNQPKQKEQSRPPLTGRTRLVPDGILLHVPPETWFRPS